MAITAIRKLTPADSKRIKCQQCIDKEFTACSAQATHCEQWESAISTKPITRSMSFHYFCEAHVRPIEAT